MTFPWTTKFWQPCFSNSNWLKMLDPKWWMVSVPLIINDFIVTSLLLLKFIVLANSLILLQTPYFLTLFGFMATLRGFLILPLNSAIWRHNDVKIRYCVNQVNYLCLDDGNDECIILCKFCWPYHVIEAGPPKPLSFGRWKQKKARSWIGLSHLVQDKIGERKATTISLVKQLLSQLWSCQQNDYSPSWLDQNGGCRLQALVRLPFSIFFFFSQSLKKNYVRIGKTFKGH